MIREKTILSSLVVVSLLYFSHLTREFISVVSRQVFGETGQIETRFKKPRRDSR